MLKIVIAPVLSKTNVNTIELPKNKIKQNMITKYGSFIYITVHSISQIKEIQDHIEIAVLFLILMQLNSASWSCLYEYVDIAISLKVIDDRWMSGLDESLCIDRV